MLVYDVWVQVLEDDPQAEDGWFTGYGDSLADVNESVEMIFPGSDWVIIENELPF